ncbi:hypothetical protein N1031_05285 [Herbiconiux moechotypicola]|uniref:Uncharacterized protein n=1 Tax=Herbiconiux moechotypicola TaxID=637393 RepID=A0ABP5QB00_9MICO|nr:hypothetical protein [Herbiconiux moechotypicola]MCS5729168.1 hypothetical protein [Herbiconiux moechotypicola]
MIVRFTGATTNTIAPTYQAPAPWAYAGGSTTFIDFQWTASILAGQSSAPITVTPQPGPFRPAGAGTYTFTATPRNVPEMGAATLSVSFV